MKSIWREIIMAVLMGLLLPGILLHWPVERDQPQRGPQPEEKGEETEMIQKHSLTMRLRKNDGTVEDMDMDAYLLGVILAELPSNFEAEAKKAQAVVARTYARKAYITGGKHADGSVCENSVCCQAYISPEQYIRQGGSRSAVDSAMEAVEATSGLVLTYGGTLIEATYFSCSGGVTEDAVAVWGTDFPYLRSVDSPGEEKATHYRDTVSFTRRELEDKLGIRLTGSPETWVGSIAYTAGGGVETIVIGGESFEGTKVRSLLGLRSTAFTLDADSDGVTITTKGFGHRVGMSQYGADAMALNGSSYQEILAHSYPGASLELTNDRQ